MRVLRIALVVGTLFGVGFIAPDARGFNLGEEWAVSFEPERIRPGEYGILEFAVTTVPDGFNIYSMTRIERGPLQMRVEFESDAFTPEGPWHARAPEIITDPGFHKLVEVYKKPVYHRRVFKLEDGEPGTLELPVRVIFQMGNARQVIPVIQTVDIRVEVESGPARPEFADPARLPGEAFSEDRTLGGDAPGAASGEGVETPSQGGGNGARNLGFAVLAALGALASPGFAFLLAVIVGLFVLLKPASWGRTLVLCVVFWATQYAVSLVAAILAGALGAVYLTGSHVGWVFLIGSLLFVLILNLVGVIKKPKESGGASTGSARPLIADIGITLAGALAASPLFVITTAGFLGIMIAMAADDGAGPGLNMLAFVFAYSIPFFIGALIVSRVQRKGPDGQKTVRVMQWVVIALFVLASITQVGLMMPGS